VGEALQAGLVAGGIAREDILLTTKLWNSNHRPGRVKPVFEASLDRLGLILEMAGEVWNRFTIHYTPRHGGWLNQAKIEIGIFSRQCLGKRRIRDLQTLRREAKAWNRRMNRNGVTIPWKFDRKTARRKFGYKRTSFRRSKT
jgi:hypothetical protein